MKNLYSFYNKIIIIDIIVDYVMGELLPFFKTIYISSSFYKIFLVFNNLWSTHLSNALEYYFTLPNLNFSLYFGISFLNDFFLSKFFYQLVNCKILSLLYLIFVIYFLHFYQVMSIFLSYLILIFHQLILSFFKMFLIFSHMSKLVSIIFFLILFI